MAGFYCSSWPGFVLGIQVLTWWFETRGIAALLNTRVERVRIANSRSIAHRSRRSQTSS
jgi:hypothetical protein